MFIDEFFDSFFVRIGPGFRSTSVKGQLYFGPCLYGYEHQEIWRPAAFAIAGTAASSFCIQPAGSDAYCRNIPLASPPLETDEEFPVVRSKRRPLILLSRFNIRDKTPFSGQNRQLHRKVGVFAPVYGTLKRDGTPKFTSVMIDRIRKLEYPHLFFLPKTSGALTEDSLMRLDHLQTLFFSHLEPHDFRLSPELLQIVDGVVRFLFFGGYDSDYKILRDGLMAS